MRHVLASCPVAPGPLGMAQPPITALLIAPSGLALRTTPRFLGAALGAVDLAAIAAAANHHRSPAANAPEEPARLLPAAIEAAAKT